MHVIRAKFRCLSVEKKWNGEALVRLGPVKRDGDRDSENNFFWKYTPSGHAELGYVAKQEPPFDVGAYYYVHFTKAETLADGTGSWRLSQLNQYDGGAEITFICSDDEALKCKWSSLKMNLSGEATGAREVLQPQGSRWNVSFTFAEATDA